MAAILGSLAAASVMSSCLDRPYRSALCVLTGIGVYASMKGPSFKEDLKSVKERLDMMSEQFKRSLVIAFSTPIVLATLTWRAICHAFASFLTSIGLIPVSAYAVISGALSVIGRYIPSVSEELQNAVPRQRPIMVGHSADSPKPDEAFSKLVSVLFTCIGAAFSVSQAMPSSFSQWVVSVTSSVMWHGTKYQSLTSFFSAVLTILRGIVDWCIGKVSRAGISARISSNRPDIIDAWLEEVDILTDPRNEDDVFSSPDWLKRTLECCELGELIFRDVMRERPVRFPLPGLMKRYGDIKRLRDRAVSWNTVTSVRKEPFCVWLEGNSGIGKSQVSNYVGYAIVRAIEAHIKGNPIYDIQPGTKFWTGCKGRLVARFDDFSILRGERNTEDLSNFMRLKSPAIFISEQAEIEDKGHPWAPIGIVINSNVAYPVNTDVQTPEAFYRRRDVMYRVTYPKTFMEAHPRLAGSAFNNPDVKEAFEALYEPPREDFYHLAFKQYRNPCDPCSGVGPEMGYNDFIKEIEVAAREYSEHQQYLFEKTVDAIAKLTNAAETDLPLAAHLDLIKNNVEEIMCKFVEPDDAKPFREWLSGFGIIKSIRDCIPDFSAIIESLPSLRKTFVGESPEEEPLPTPEDLGVKESGKIWSFVRRAAHKTLFEQKGAWRFVKPVHGPACLCHEAFSRSLREGCAHLAKAHIFDPDSGGWKYYPDTMNFAHGVITIPLICGVRCVLAVSGISACLKATNSWFAPHMPSTLDSQEETEVTEEGKTFLGWMKTTVGTILSAIYSCLSSVLFYIISFLVIGGYFVYKKLSVGKQEPAHPTKFKDPTTTSGNIVSSGDPRSSKLARASKAGVRFKTFKSDPKAGQGPQDIHHLIQGNVVWLQYQAGDTPLGSPMRAYGISGYYAVTLKHYWHSTHKPLATHMRVMRCARGGLVTDVSCALSSIEMIDAEETEYQVIKLPPQVTTAFKDIRHHFGSANSFEKTFYPRTATILCQKPDQTEIINVTVDYPITSSPVLSPTGYQTSVVQRPIRYPWGGAGHCMSVLLGYMAGRQFILGFHVAGSMDKSVTLGMAEPMFVEMLEELNPQVKGREEPPVELVGESDPSICIDSSVIPICTIVKEYAQARTTKIIPSALQPLLELPAETAPAPLTRSQVPDRAFDPMVESVKPHGQPAQACHPSVYARCHEDYTEMVLSSCLPVSGRTRVLTVEEAVEGIPEMGLKSLELSTSEGFPYVLYRTTAQEQNKRWLITREVENGRNVCKEIHRMLADTLTRKDDLRRKGIVPFTVFSDCLKDARVPIFKLSKPGATRVISVSPVDYTIQFRQYFGAFLSAFRHHRMELEHAIGINVQGLEWTILAGKLHGPGFTKFIDGDHSKFGPRLDPVDSFDFVDTINQWYRRHDTNNPTIEQECAVRTIMIHEANQAYHLVGNLIYQVMCGMPSGFPGTTEWNCASNSKWIRRAWLDCWKDDPSMCNFVAYKKHVRLYTYGDDLAIGISDLAATKFNGIFLRDFFRRHDMKFTDAQKGDSIDAYKSFDEISFLKHQWVPHPVYPTKSLARIEERSVHECYRWIHNDGLIQNEKDKVIPTLQNCEMSLFLAYGHGKEFYEKLRKTFLDWYRNCKDQESTLPTPRFYTWEELDAIIWPLSPDEQTEGLLAKLKQRYEEYLGDAVILNLEP